MQKAIQKIWDNIEPCPIQFSKGTPLMPGMLTTDPLPVSGGIPHPNPIHSRRSIFQSHKIFRGNHPGIPNTFLRRILYAQKHNAKFDG